MKLWQNVLFALLAVVFLYAVIEQDKFFHPKEPRSSHSATIEVPEEATPEEVSRALEEAKDTGKDVVIQFEPPPSPEEVAALQPCREMLDSLTVGPPINDERRCRVNDREATLLTVALEDSDEWEFVGPGEPMRKKGNAP